MKCEEYAECPPLISRVQALQIFRQWLGEGLFSDKELSETVAPQIEVLYLPFCFAIANADARWSVIGGIFDDRDWERDYEDYNRAYARWKEAGMNGRAPKSPDRDNYYDWREASGRWEATESSVTVPAFDASYLGGSDELFEAAYQFVEEYKGKVLESWRYVDDDNYRTVNLDLAYREIIRVLNNRAHNSVQKETQRFDKIREVNIDHLDVDARAAACYIAFYKVEYTRNDKTYTCLVDALVGELVVGPRARSPKKIALAVGAAALALCIGVGSWMHGGQTTPSPASEPEGVEQAPASAEPAAIPPQSAKASAPAPEQPVVEAAAPVKKMTGYEASLAFLQQNGERENVVTTSSGLQVEILTPSEGARPTFNDVISIHFEGWLPDRTRVASSKAGGGPETVRVRDMIRGLSEGVQYMPVGSKFRFVLPPELGFGQGASETIPPDSAIIMDVELLAIESSGHQNVAANEVGSAE